MVSRTGLNRQEFSVETWRKFQVYERVANVCGAPRSCIPVNQVESTFT